MQVAMKGERVKLVGTSHRANQKGRRGLGIPRMFKAEYCVNIKQSKVIQVERSSDPGTAGSVNRATRAILTKDQTTQEQKAVLNEECDIEKKTVQTIKQSETEQSIKTDYFNSV